MKKSQLAKITTILPFDGNYIKVGKNNNKLWNLMDSEGNLVTETWFEEIERKNDGTIVVKNENKEVKFTNVNNFRKYDYTSKIVPTCVMDMVDLGSIKTYDLSDKYVATAKFYNRTVFITADGRIFDSNDNEMRILFNTVDTERLNNALLKFNKKLNYGFNPNLPDLKWKTVVEYKQSLFGYYYISEELRIDAGQTPILITDNSPRQVSENMSLVATKIMPENVREELTKKLGTPRYKEDAEHPSWAWDVNKNNLDFVIDTLNNI